MLESYSIEGSGVHMAFSDFFGKVDAFVSLIIRNGGIIVAVKNYELGKYYFCKS